ncbi:MAG: hypothetical protein KatS3mg097_222 [Candidatus Parcubacteria bacterium]|nr:MAG: hypothetical protein KatS3mg097_222 [Candidatus Parcubacteria bacterium]
MPVLQLTIGKILKLIEGTVQILYDNLFFLSELFFYILILTFCFILITKYIINELKYQKEIKKWQTYYKLLSYYFFLKKKNKRFAEIKETFYLNKIAALYELRNLLHEALTTFGYEGSLKEQLEAVKNNLIPNVDQLKKAETIFNLLEEKYKQQGNIKLNENDFLVLFHTYETALFNLKIINQEDFLATHLK